MKNLDEWQANQTHLKFLEKAIAKEIAAMNRSSSPALKEWHAQNLKLLEATLLTIKTSN